MDAQGSVEGAFLADGPLASFRLLAFFECDTVPKDLFTRAYSHLYQWNGDGELEYHLPMEVKMPLGLLDAVDEAEARGIVTVEGSIWSQHYTMSEEWKCWLRRDLDRETVTVILFDILSIAIRAFPEVWSEIAWKEVQDQLWDVVQSTCVPFLGVLEIEDVLAYLSGISSAGKNQYLAYLLKFLIRLSALLKGETPPNFFTIISRGIQLLQGQGGVSLADQRYLQLMASITDALNREKMQPMILVQYLQSLDHHGSVRLNAMIGLALSSLPPSWLASYNNNQLRLPGLVWKPLSGGNLSPMEILAQGQLFGASLVMESADIGWNNLSLQIKIQIAFHEMKSERFESALEILERTIMEVEETYGASSMEFLLTGTSLVVCCNVTAKEEAGGAWAQFIWLKEFGYPTGEVIIKSPQQTYLMVALADSLLGQGKYDDAQHLLRRVLEYPSTASSTLVRVALRLLKMNRRQRKPPDWTLLEKAVSKFYDVSDPLKYHCLEETICLLSDLDPKDVVQTPQVSRIITTLNRYRIYDYAESAISRRNLQENLQSLQQYKKKFNLFSVSGGPLHYCVKIRDRFPCATVQFIEKLAAESWRRFKRIQEMPTLVMEDKEASRKSEVEIPGADTSKSAFYDSGLGSSIQITPTRVGPCTRSVASVRSFMSYEGDVATAPPPPPEVSTGKTFHCDICKRTIKDVTNKSQWERHLYADLRPYVCIIEDCDADPVSFASRAEFAVHLAGHEYMWLWTCKKCGFTEGTQKLVQEHTYLAHTLSKESEVEISEKKVHRDVSTQKCPFCHKIPGAVSFVGHVCHHLEEISLAALLQQAEPEDHDQEVKFGTEPPSTPRQMPGEETTQATDKPVLVPQDTTDSATRKREMAVKLKAIATEEFEKTVERPTIHMNPEMKQIMVQKLEGIGEMLGKVEESIPFFFFMTSRESLVRELTRVRILLLQQLQDDRCHPKDSFSITPDELDAAREKLKKYFHYVMIMLRGSRTAPNQQPNLHQDLQQPTEDQTQPLSIANLQQYQQTF